jgi:phosphoribosylformylglycinamidine synthase
MPHPEAYNHVTNHPDWTRQAEKQKRAGRIDRSKMGAGIRIFENAVTYLGC